MSAHTPGDWEAVYTTAEAAFPGGCPVAVQRVGTNDRAGRICEIIAQGDGYYDPAVTTANAHLIAAAPKLLEACERALAAFVAMDFARGRPGRWRPIKDVLRDAIAKTKGET